MTIEETLVGELTQAMKARDQKVVDALRMAKSKIVERQKAPGFEGPMTDRVAQDAIAAYVKSLKKAIEDAKIKIESAELDMLPKNMIKVTGDDAQKVLDLVEVLEDNEDVQHVYANFDIDEKELASLNN